MTNPIMTKPSQNNSIKVGVIFNSAWSRIRGAKGAIWNVAIVMILIAATIKWLTNQYITVDNQIIYYWLQYLLIPLLTNLCIAPFYGGSFMVAIKQVRGETIDLRAGYHYLHRTIPTAICMAVIGVLSNLLIMIINVPAIAIQLGHYLSYFDLAGILFSIIIYALFIFSIPLVIDNNDSASSALLRSVKIALPYFRQILSTLILAYLCLFIATIPVIISVIINRFDYLKLIAALFFIIAMVWLLPFFFLLGAELYQRIVKESSIKSINNS